MHRTSCLSSLLQQWSRDRQWWREEFSTWYEIDFFIVLMLQYEHWWDPGSVNWMIIIWCSQQLLGGTHLNEHSGGLGGNTTQILLLFHSYTQPNLNFLILTDRPYPFGYVMLRPNGFLIKYSSAFCPVATEVYSISCL